MKYGKLLAGLILFSPLASTDTFADKMAITIYNDNLALVRDSRTLDFKSGINEYRFTEVAAQIDPTSVHFKVPGNNNIRILEQNYEYDLVGTQRLLEKYVDQQIIVTTTASNTFRGKLLSAQSGDVIIETPDKLVKVLKAAALETVEFPAVAGGLITKPTLVWLLQSAKSEKQEAEISYLTGGINWHAEYVALVNDKDTELELSGWVSIENNSGANYRDAKLKLVAGDVNIVKPQAPPRAFLAKAAFAEDAGAPQFEEKSFFEYHLYTLSRPATINDRQIKQLELFPTANTAVKKLFTFNGQRDGKDVKVNIEMTNSKASGMGMPLPKGKIRVYKSDADGSQEFIGEDMIDHTPQDEKLRIYLGNAFDIVGERIVKDIKKIGNRSRQETVAITLRNHKKENVTITVIENMWGDWDFIGQTPKILTRQANKVEFEATVPATGETSFEFVVLYQY